MSGKVIYADLSLEGINLELATKSKADALASISLLLAGLVLHQPDGERVTVMLELDEFAFGRKAFKQAQAAPLGKSKYKISIGVGLIIQLSVIARSIAADETQLRGRTKSRLLQKDVRGDGREKALADFVFHFMVTFIVWHEVSHILLGHIDWLQHSTGLGIINEFSVEPMPDNEFTRRQTLEADADRQAAIFTASTIDNAAEKNLYLRYMSRTDLFYDIGYIHGALFGFLDAIDGRPAENRRLHPKADIRLGVALGFVLDYLNKIYPQSARLLHQQVIAGGLTALSRILHQEKQGLDPCAIYAFMSQNGKRMEHMDIRRFQHKVSSAMPGSFQIVGM